MGIFSFLKKNDEEKIENNETISFTGNEQVQTEVAQSNVAPVVEEVQQTIVTPQVAVAPTTIETPQTDVASTTLGTSNETSYQSTTLENTNIDPNRKKVLLVVDDNKLNLRVASKLLSEFNCDIETVQSGKECIEKVQQDNKYDLIFMDIMMPDMNGVETMHKLKSMDNFHIPVVSLTADAVEGSREKYLGEGFDEYIAKPMDKEAMREAIEKYAKLTGYTPKDNNTQNVEEL